MRIKNIDHHIVGEKQSPSSYTIKDDIVNIFINFFLNEPKKHLNSTCYKVYTINIEEYTDGKWAPFKGKDVQLEFVRLDPFVRMTLENKNGKFEGKFKVPDVYGIFKFVVDYNRIGYTHLFSSTQVNIKPWFLDDKVRYLK